MSANKDYSNPVAATLSGVADLFRKRERIGRLQNTDRLDGLTALITGANSGLGRATAIELGRRGATLILACRRDEPAVAAAISAAANGARARMLKLDLSDLRAVDRACDQLRDEHVRLDRVVLNAGVVPRSPQRSAQGFEMMFATHYLGNRRLLERLLQDGVIPNRHFATVPRPAGPPARIVFVASETHRSGHPIDLAHLGEFVDYGAMGSIAQYGHSKLVMTTYLQELGRRLQDAEGLDVAVHALCPGPINSNIARDAPALFRPLLGAVMGLLFASPEKACEPVVYLSTAAAVADRSGIYLHLMSEKPPAPQALDESLAAALWEAGAKLQTQALDAVEAAGVSVAS